MSIRVEHGDSRDVLKTLPDGSVDSVVTDPPYALTANKKGGSGVASVNLESPYGRARIGTTSRARPHRSHVADGQAQHGNRCGDLGESGGQMMPCVRPVGCICEGRGYCPNWLSDEQYKALAEAYAQPAPDPHECPDCDGDGWSFYFRSEGHPSNRTRCETCNPNVGEPADEVRGR